jgi:hypothetical protein
MKKIFTLVVIATFLIIPTVSSAKTAIPDSDLGSIFAQACLTGDCVTIVYDDINVKSKTLKTTSTDGLDFWGDDHASVFGPAHPDYENNMPLGSSFPSKGYIGYADVYLTGDTVRRSGSITIEVFNPDNDPTAFDYTNVLSRRRLAVEINTLTVDTGNMSIDAAIKLGSTPDLAGDQYLGRTYTSGVSTTTGGQLSVYAHNNSPF